MLSSLHDTKRERLKKSFTFLFLIQCFFVCISCRQSSPKITPAFYHWQTNFQLSNFEKTYLDSLNVSKLYVKFFDVDWDGKKVVPKAVVDFLPYSPLKEELPELIAPKINASNSSPFSESEGKIIPTIFITNRTLKNLKSEDLNNLSQKTITKIFQITKDNNLKINELQIDCDWTLTTKEKYFELLRLINKELPEGFQLSVTIRLHQIKYSKKTGIPPVEKGVLMYYNMGDLENLETENSILDNEIGKQYLANLNNYPLKLDLALPIFRWGVLFRDGRMIRLINDLRSNDLIDTTRFQKNRNHHFEVKKSTYLDGHYLYQGDLIRLEKIVQEDLLEAAEILFPYFKSDFEVIFYHLNENNLHDFSVEKISEILTP